MATSEMDYMNVGCEKHYLLWSHATPAVATNQNITISGVILSDYDFLEIYTNDGGYLKIPTKNENGVPTNYSGFLITSTYATSAPQYGAIVCQRGVTYNVAGNSINISHQIASYVGNVGVTQDTVLIPYYIYGVK